MADTASVQRLLEDIKSEVAAGRKIDAIKLYRDATGTGLEEAKEAVELIAAGKPPRPGTPLLPEEVQEELETMIAAGRKIEAIRLYRDAAGVDLKEAKEAVDRLEERIEPAAVVTRAAKMRRLRSVLLLGLLVAAGIGLVIAGLWLNR